MQGIPFFIPTEQKVQYINTLLKVGFDTIDFGSFVSPKAIPQMKDTAEVLSKLDLEHTPSKLLAIVGNTRGAEDATKFPEISYLGFPFSISETFQKRNLNTTITDSVKIVEKIQTLCVNSNKELVIYISMGLGNPYGDEWSIEIVEEWTKKLFDMGIRIISLSDTVGTAIPKDIHYLFSNLIPRFPDIEFGAHLHARPDNWLPNIEAAYKGGCKRFDGAMRGYGGCPMAKDDLVGNMPTENIIQYLRTQREELSILDEELTTALRMAYKIFPPAS